MMLFGTLIFTSKIPKVDHFHFANHYESGFSLRIKIVEELKHSDYYFKYKAEIIAVEQTQTRGSVLLRIIKNSDDSPIHLNEDILTFHELSELKKPLNPGAYDFKEAMKKKHIYHQLTLDQDQFIRIKTKHSSLKTEALIFREKILQSLRNKGFAKKEFSVIEALLLGRRQDLSNKLMTSYQNAGAMHLLAISGLHIGILLMILNFLLKPIERFKQGKKVKLLFMIGFLWLFAFLSGLSVSVLRAVFMFTILSIGLYLNRNGKLSHYLFTALFLSLIIKPSLVFDLGFQLSYSAVLAIIGISPVIKALWKPNNYFINYIWNLLAISLAAQIGVLPLSLYYFHQFSALFILSSLCIIPFLGVILGMGYLLIILNYFNYLPEFYIKTYSWFIQLMNGTIELLGSINQLVFRRVFFTLTLLIFSYMLIVFLISWLKTHLAKWAIASLLCVVFIFFDLLMEKRNTERSAAFIIFQQYKASLMVNRTGGRARVYSPFDKEDTPNIRLLNNYKLSNYKLETEKSLEMKHFFRIGNERIMILDHQAVTSDFGFNPDILVLTNSPRINLDRLLQEIHPKTIVADGSNFFTYKILWKRTAEKSGIIFHDTAQKGAFAMTNPI